MADYYRNRSNLAKYCKLLWCGEFPSNIDTRQVETLKTDNSPVFPAYHLNTLAAPQDVAPEADEVRKMTGSLSIQSVSFHGGTYIDGVYMDESQKPRRRPTRNRSLQVDDRSDSSKAALPPRFSGHGGLAI